MAVVVPTFTSILTPNRDFLTNPVKQPFLIPSPLHPVEKEPDSCRPSTGQMLAPARAKQVSGVPFSPSSVHTKGLSSTLLFHVAVGLLEGIGAFSLSN